MDMNLLKYRAFVATVEDGSFTRAAERLHYSQSGISRMIADLEREWNLTLLEKGTKAEIAALFERYHLQPNVHFTTWDDYAVMSMVESGLGISILPELILKRVPYRIAIRELDVPALRTIAIHFPLAGFCIIAGSVCQAVGNPFHSLTTSVCRQLLVLLPVAWLLSRTGNLHLVWFAFPIAELMSLLVSSIFLRKTMRRLDRDLA